MNRKQLTALWIGIGLAVLVGLFPPWTKTFTADNIESVTPLGHASLLKPPTEGLAYPVEGVGIDGIRLAIMLGTIFIVTAGIIVSTRNKPSTPFTPSAASAQHNGNSKDQARSTEKRRSQFAHAGFWLLVVAGAIIHVIVTCGVDATQYQYIQQATYGFVTVFLFGCIGGYIVGVFSQNQRVQLAGCILGIALALTATLYLNRWPSSDIANSTAASTTLPPNTVESTQPTNPFAKDDIFIRRVQDFDVPSRQPPP